MQVRQERTGWRDEELSRRHREWGWDCPAVDIDFLLLEYDRGLPVALVEYKNQRASINDQKHPSYQAISEMANRARLPFFWTRYASDFSWFEVVPMNDIAKGVLPGWRQMTEGEWVSFLYNLRGRTHRNGNRGAS